MSVRCHAQFAYLGHHPIAVGHGLAQCGTHAAVEFKQRDGTRLGLLRFVFKILKCGCKSADIVLVKNSLSDFCSAVLLGRRALRNIHENLFWAFVYNVAGIPLAAGVFYNSFGWSLNPMFCAAAMGLSSFFVVTNALRLNMVRIRNKINVKEEKTMVEKKIKVEGMMCAHCEAHVKEALESVAGIEKAVADHNTGDVLLTCL